MTRIQKATRPLASDESCTLPQGHQPIKIYLIMLKQTHLLSHSPSAIETSTVCDLLKKKKKAQKISFQASTFGNKFLLIIRCSQHAKCKILPPSRLPFGMLNIQHAQQTHTLLYVNMYLKINTVQSHKLHFQLSG